MAIQQRQYLLEGVVDAAQIERLCGGPITLKYQYADTTIAVEYDDTQVIESNLDEAMAAFGFVPATLSTYSVRSLADLPTPVGGVITLDAKAAYEIEGVIDITPNVILLQDGTTLIGRSPSTDQIVSHQAAAVLQVNAAPASDTVAVIQSLQIINGVADCVDFTGDAFVLMSLCGLAGVSAGRLHDLKRAAIADCVLQQIANGFRFEGSITSTVFSRLQAYDMFPGCTVVQALAPCTFGLLQLSDSTVSFSDVSQNGFDLDESIATSAADDAVGVMGNLFRGPGTPLVAGVGKAAPATSPNPPWRFMSNIGIADTP
jgi:hypothetical protein